MLNQCFSFLDGIRDSSRLYKLGLKNWDDFLKCKSVKGISAKRKLHYDRQINKAKEALAKEELGFFIENFPKKELWRLYSNFKDRCCFLDIEIDSYGKVILLTICDRFESKTFVKGINLEKELLEKELGKYKLIATYNGSAFDIPKIERELNMKISLAHIDLKPICQRLGLKGGLKEIEVQLGINRPKELKGNASSAWRAFMASGDKEWLDVLVKYNEEDAVNLYRVMEKCVAKLSA